MDSFPRIHEFLAAVRRRLQGRSARQAALLALTAVAALSLLVPLVAAGSGAGSAGDLRAIGFALLLAAVAGLVAFGVILPRRRWRDPSDVARFVGDAAPPVASDLLSAVELEKDLERGTPSFSSELAHALAGDTATRLAALRPAALVNERGTRRATKALLAALGAYALALLIVPSALRTGWDRLLSPPNAVASGVSQSLAVPEPLVGDITITLTYPKHTSRPPLTVPASSGDVTAPRGTEVSIVTRALHPAVEAKILFDEAGGTAAFALPMTIQGDVLRASFTLERAGAYRFELHPPAGRALVEADAHRLDVEADRAPRVELYAPAEELEVSSRKRIELAYTTDDDYGLGEISLVWKTAGGRDERKVIPLPKGGGRTAQGKFFWDLADVQLQPGVRIAYHLEVKDNDVVGGPNVGSSRSYYLKVYSPRQRHEEILDRHDAVLEMAIGLLGDRLEVDGGREADGGPRAGSAGRGGGAGPGDAQSIDVDKHRVNNTTAQRLVSEIGQLLTMVGQDPLSTKGLDKVLDEMRARLDKLARDEQLFLDDLDAKVNKTPGRTIAKAQLAALAIEDRKQIAELEKDVILLDDWLQRQRLEELLAISDEIKQRRERLKDLLAEYKRTGSEKVRQEIEREIKALEQLQAELMRKMAELGGEVADRFLNAEALQAEDAQDCLAKVRELLEKGDILGSQAQLEKCADRLEAASRSLEQGLRGLRGDKFSDEEKAYSELMDEVADLEQDQRQVAKETDELIDEYDKRAAEHARDKANPAREQAKKTLEKLKKKLDAVPRDGLTEFAQEEYDSLRRRVEDVERMVDEGDVGEALSMAKQALQAIQTIQAELDDDMADGHPYSDKSDEAMEEMHEAEPLAEKLIEELEQATPSASEVMSAKDKKQLDELRRRQQALQERTGKVAQKAQKRAKDLPGRAGEMAQKGLEEVGEQQGRAGRRLQAADPHGGRDEAHGAAEKLGNLRKSLGSASRPTQVGNGRDGNADDEVRIPGSEDYKPPEEFREDILNAKRKERAPDAFKDQVERYYQELVK